MLGSFGLMGDKQRLFIMMKNVERRSTSVFFGAFRKVARLMVFVGTLVVYNSAFAVTASDVEPFSKPSPYGKARLSPDGTFLAVEADRDGLDVVVILKVATMGPSHVVQFLGENDQVGDFHWVSDDRLVVTVSRFVKSEMERPFEGGELFAVNADGSKQKKIFSYVLPPNTRKKKNSGVGFGGFAFMVDGLEDDRKNALIRACGFSGTTCDIYRINVFNGALRDRQRLPARSSSVVFDSDNMAQYSVAETELGFREVYRRTKSGWDLTGRYPYPGGALIPFSLSVQDDAVYALDGRDGGPGAVVKMDRALASGEQVYRHRLTDISDFHADKDGSVYAVEAGLGKPELVDIQPGHPDLLTLKSLREVFPTRGVSIVDQAEKGNLLLVATYSDRVPSEYFLYNKKKNSLQFLIARRPWVKEAESLAMLPVEFMSRDGLQITGYLTLPNGASKERPAPLIVNPHGGPHGPFDSWGYLPDTQFLASQGYAVLQVNFRGSGGFGADFEAAGFQKWGREIQLDIIDGAQYVLANFPVDSDRVGIMGGSFGGYSALQSSILAPDLFKAAVGVVGVYDFKLMYTAGDIRGRFSGRRYLEKALGKAEADFQEFSPVRRVSELKAPVLLIQGEKDERAPVEHSDVLARVLEARSHPHEYVIMPNEGHGFYKAENRIRYFMLFSDFFDRHLGKNSY